jgi:hypothetical protein
LERSTFALLASFLSAVVAVCVLAFVYSTHNSSNNPTGRNPESGVSEGESPVSELPQMSTECDNSGVSRTLVRGVGVTIDWPQTKVTISLINTSSLTHLDGASLRLYDTDGDEVSCDPKTSALTLDAHLLQPNETFRGTLDCTLVYDAMSGRPPRGKTVEVKAVTEEHGVITTQSTCTGEPTGGGPE